MRLNQVTPSQRRLLEEIARKISRKLEALLIDLPGTNEPHMGVELRERGHMVVAEVPIALLQQATEDAPAREALRVRLKVRRDRMLFKPPPAALSKRVVPLPDPGFGRFAGGRRTGRGRR